MPNAQKVLFANSREEVTIEIASSLRRRGAEVVLAGDAVAVLAMALRHRPGVVVLGGHLDAGGALVALRRLRASVHTAGIPIVAAAAPGADQQALLSAGAEACVSLPLDVEELWDSIEAHLGVPSRVQGAPAGIVGDRGRLGALDQTGWMDTEPDEELDLITRLAARLVGVPVALVSLVDDRRQFFKSQIGLPEPWDQRRQTPLSHSFCQWVVSSDTELVVSDARHHPVLSRNGAVADLGVVAYAGVPLSAVTGETIGSFCAIDGKPRTWTAHEVATLRDLGRIVDAYAALQPRTKPGSIEDEVEFPLRVAARAAGSGFVGASRLLLRHGDVAGVSAEIAGIIERHGHRLVEASGPDERQRAAA